jgi:hypothetical protein
MPKYILHIGPPKSGSKYIQSQLFHNRKSLAEKGILYPDIWWTRPDKIMHDSVRDDLAAGKDLGPDFERLNASGARTIVLSCEAFDGLRPDALSRLRQYIGDNPVDVIYYARRWSDRIPSDWRQRVMMGNIATFPEFYIRFLSNPEGTGEINYSIVWDEFAKIFGRESLRIVSFTNLVDRGVDLFKHFCEVIVGVSDVPQIEKGLVQLNAGPEMIDAELMRVLNYLYKLETSREDPSMRIKFDRLKTGYDLSALREHMKTDMRRIKLKDNAVPLRTTWQAISAYRDRLVSPEYGKEIFRQRDVEIDFVGQNYLFRDGAIDEVRRLYRFLNSEKVESLELQALQ